MVATDGHRLAHIVRDGLAFDTVSYTHLDVYKRQEQVGV